MVGTYLGFAVVSGMSIFWVLAPFRNPQLVWAIGGKGLRTTLTLERLLRQAARPAVVRSRSRASRSRPARCCCSRSPACWSGCSSAPAPGISISAARSNPRFARAAGISDERTRIQATVLSTVIAAIGIVVFAQSYGFLQLYTAPLLMAFPAVACLLIGGASVSRATLTHVVIGTVPVPVDPDGGAAGDEPGDPGRHLGDRAAHHPERHDPLRADAPERRMSARPPRDPSRGSRGGDLRARSRTAAVPLLFAVLCLFGIIVAADHARVPAARDAGALRPQRAARDVAADPDPRRARPQLRHRDRRDGGQIAAIVVTYWGVGGIAGLRAGVRCSRPRSRSLFGIAHRLAVQPRARAARW